MPTVPLHPALVHVPLGLALVLPLVMAALAFGLWRALVPRRAWLIVLALQGILILGGFAALRTGERDEKRVENVVGERALDTHEDAAEAFLWGATVALVLSAGTLVVPKRAAPATAAIGVAAMLVVAYLGYRTGKAGGELVYARGAAIAYSGAASAGSTAPAQPGRRSEHDDD
jgi:uncharacterized membrane protein